MSALLLILGILAAGYVFFFGVRQWLAERKHERIMASGGYGPPGKVVRAWV